jgi:cobaltochelatase CobS
MNELETSVAAGFHVMLTGPRGTGKTTAVKQIARQKNKPLFLCQGHSDLTVEELRGLPGLREGSSTFQPGPVVQAIKGGAYLLFDEVNTCRPGVTAWLNNILDGDGLVAVPETGELLPVPPGFLAFFCFNEGYAGTRALNEALKDRCRVIWCDYWPEDTERTLLRSLVKRLADIDIDRMLWVTRGIRKARREGTIDFDLSIRTLCQWGCDADLRTQDLLESFRSVVLPKVGDPHEYQPQYQALMEIAKLVIT